MLFAIKSPCNVLIVRFLSIKFSTEARGAKKGATNIVKICYKVRIYGNALAPLRRAWNGENPNEKASRVVFSEGF